jgi:hypothetical protein
MTAEQHLVAASEVKRSGTRALSGFMRAKRDTLRRGGRLVVAACFESGGKFRKSCGPDENGEKGENQRSIGGYFDSDP